MPGISNLNNKAESYLLLLHSETTMSNQNVIQGKINRWQQRGSLMAAAKSACKEKKWAKMSFDLTSAWKGIKHMVHLDYDSSSATFGYPSKDFKIAWF